jgi:hypothetical protein
MTSFRFVGTYISSALGITPWFFRKICNFSIRRFSKTCTSSLQVKLILEKIILREFSLNLHKRKKTTDKHTRIDT